MDSKAALQPQRADSEARNPARRAGWFTKGNVLGVFAKNYPKHVPCGHFLPLLPVPIGT